MTCEAAWAVNESVNAGFAAPEGLQNKLAGALKKIATGQIAAEHFERCLALFVLTQSGTDDEFKTVSHDLNLRRNEATNEGRALLAIALHRQDIMPNEKEQLLKEIDVPIKERAFNPRTLSSITREEAMRAFAYDTVGPKFYVPQKKQGIHDAMLKLMDSSASLSTQENLWLLLAFKSMIGAEKGEAINTAEPKGVASKNGRSVAWLDRKVETPLLIGGLNKIAMTFLMEAQYSTPEVDTERVDRGFRVERVVEKPDRSKADRIGRRGLQVRRSNSDHLPHADAKAAKLRRGRRCAASRPRSCKSGSGNDREVFRNAAERSARLRSRSFPFGNARPRYVALFRQLRARLRRLLGPGPCYGSRNIPLAGDTGRPDV